MLGTSAKPFAAACVLLLAGCVTAPVTPVIDVGQTEQRATAEEADGNFARAAELYRTLADSASGADRAAYLLESARLEIGLRNYARATQLLTLAERDAEPGQRTSIEIFRSRIELAQEMASQALARVDALPSPSGDALLAVLEIRGRALFALGRPVEAIRSLVEREVWLDDIEAIRNNQRLIWDALQAAPIADGGPSGDPTVDGWIALGQIAGVMLEDERRRELIQWRTAHNQHPAARVLLTELLLDQVGAFPSQIALLLPLSTPAREAALAIRDGFFAAHLASGQEQTLVRVYDTGQEGATAAYTRAQIDGANFIVGPLLREDVEAVMAQAGLTPTLALNYSLNESLRPANAYEFALAPEDEARAAAAHALAQGYRRAVALVESTDRGYRIFNSFRATFEAGGGQVLSMMGYDDDVRSYSTRITALMNVDRSNQRHRRLAANLRSEVVFEPRRRQDIDVIFLAANADYGRLLAPQLEYWYAGDVPTYAIAEIYDPQVTPGTRDLDRVVFPDVPWLITPSTESATLRSTIAQHWPMRNSDVPRFYGLGFDAHRIVETLYAEPFFASIVGMSGLLTMDLEGRIHRELPFARIRNGRPEPVQEWPPLFEGEADLPNSDSQRDPAEPADAGQVDELRELGGLSRPAQRDAQFPASR